jgi:hypothetical protein
VSIHTHLSIKIITIRLLVPPGQEAVDAGALNLGIKDQRLALEWIQKNIGYFGGDPTKVCMYPFLTKVWWADPI